MAPGLFVFIHAINVVKAPNTPETPIIVQPNNDTFSVNIPPQHQDLGMEDFVNFFKSCTLRYALSDVPGPFSPKQLYEFYYSCTIDASGQTISRTVGDGHSRVHIYVITILQALCLPLMIDYEKILLKLDVDQFYLIIIIISLTRIEKVTLLSLFFVNAFLLAGSMLQR